MSEYWDQRYIERNMTSGSGSYGEELQFKLSNIDLFIENKSSIKTILDVGCGDLHSAWNFLEMFSNFKYVGIDSAERWIEYLKKTVHKNSPLKFKYVPDGVFNIPSDVVFCLDVLFHIMDDKHYENMLESIKKSFKKYLFITTYNSIYEGDDSSYIKYRKFNPEYFGEYTEIKCPVLREEHISLYMYKKI